MNTLTRITLLRGAIAVGLGISWTPALYGQNESATAQISGQPLGGGSFSYDINVQDTSVQPIGTFWYSWVPGDFFLPHSPTSVSPPVGWNYSIVPGNGAYSIEFTSSSAIYDIPSAGSLDFDFVTTDSPATLAGTFNGAPVGTSYIYGGGPFSDGGYQLTVQSVPEPSGLALIAAASAVFGIATVKRKSRGFAFSDLPSHRNT